MLPLGAMSILEIGAPVDADAWGRIRKSCESAEVAMADTHLSNRIAELMPRARRDLAELVATRPMYLPSRGWQCEPDQV